MLSEMQARLWRRSEHNSGKKFTLGDIDTTLLQVEEHLENGKYKMQRLQQMRATDWT